MIKFCFNADKAVQLAAGFLRLVPEQVMNYTKLIKLMYLADRASILETGLPITGDSMYALPNGPILSYTLSCIYGEANDSEWNKYFRRHGRYELAMNEDPGDGLLSRRDLKIAQALYDRYIGYDYNDMIRATHRLGEWRKNNPGRSSVPISVEDILQSESWPEEAIAGIAELAKESLEVECFAACSLLEEDECD